MPLEIKTIKFGGVNAYLLKNGDSFLLIDAGYPARRAFLEKELTGAGCRPGNLKLVILTHGDIDHIGNCVWLLQKYGAKIAMHQGDIGMAESGDMNWNRKTKSDKYSLMFRMMSNMTVFFKPGKFEVFTPDLTIDESFELAAYGFDARVLYLPGHSKGSLGVLTGGERPLLRRPDIQFLRPAGFHLLYQ